MTVHTIDCNYLDRPGVAAAYLLVEGGEAAFVETNTARAVPRLLEALEDAGLQPEDVRWVCVTHAHLDHAGGAWSLLRHCPRATLLAHPRAIPHLIEPARLVRGATEVYGEARFRALYGTIEPIPADRVQALADGERFSWGERTLTALHTRGHANHHLVLHDSRERAVFTGDAFGLCYPALQGGGTWIFPSTSPTGFDGPAALESIDRIVATGAERAFLTHFGEVDALEGAAEQLRAELRFATALVEEADREGLEGAALESHVRRALERRYDAAMRARGLGAEARSWLELDLDLNAQGLVFAVKKARYKRVKG